MNKKGVKKIIIIIIIVLIILGGLYFIRKINHDKMENFTFRRRRPGIKKAKADQEKKNKECKTYTTKESCEVGWRTIVDPRTQKEVLKSNECKWNNNSCEFPK